MADIVSASQEILVGQYCTLAPFVILYYDYFLTLPLEIERFWPQRTFSWASFFFYVNRYMALLGQIPIIISFFSPQAPQTCLYLLKYHNYFVMVTQMVVGTLLIMRVYALYDRSRTVLAFLCITSGAVVIIAVWSSMSAKGKGNTIPIPVPHIGCTDLLSTLESIQLLAIWGYLLVFDTLVFVMTVAKAFMVGRSGDQTLINILLRDGSIYFLVLCWANLLNLATLLLGGLFIKGIGTTFANILSVVMISRLMLNLRSPSLIQEKSSIDTDSDFSSSVQHRVSTVVYPLPCDTFVGFEPSQGGYIGKDGYDMDLVSRSV